MGTGDWAGVVRTVAARLAAAGIDIVHPYAPSRVEGGERATLGLLIGNTRALWAPFVAACRADARLASDADPIERYCETHIGAAVADLPGATLRWAHGAAPHLPIQQLAVRSGLAAMSPVGLCIHPRYGPWFALRAAVTVTCAGPPGAPVEVPLPCADCARACVPPFARAQAAQAGRADLAATWRLWLAVRDACPVGRAHRYGEAQRRYRYARDRSVITTACAARTPRGSPPRARG
ncbi:MAG: hypothetical protein U0802_12165 [Candidatus Binatia bacterium]